MKTVIVEDEKPILELMKLIINKNKNLEIIAQFTDSKEALEGILKLSPDVVFVDVEMPFMSGIELSRRIKSFNENIQIVFVTAYEKYAVEAFKVNAVNYILKPFTEEDLNTTVNRLLKNQYIKEITPKQNKKNRIFVLGYFRVYGSSGNEITKWSTAKVRELFAYFIYKKGKYTDKWQLCDKFWPDSPPKNAEHNLHSTIYRLKTVLKNARIKDVIYYGNGKYGMDLKDFYCDCWQFQNFVDSNPVINEKNAAAYEKNIALYNGTLFGNEDYFWSADLNEKLKKYYLFSTKNIAKYYMKIKLYNKSDMYLKKAISVNPFDEAGHELMMKVYFHMGDRIGLFNYYNKLNTLFKRELHIPPKKSTTKLYKNLFMKL